MTEQYKPVPGIEGLECTYDGKFKYKGKEKKVLYCHVVNGRKATARLTIMINGRTKYWQAAKLVAQTWKHNYKIADYIIYKDGNCHNIKADNLLLSDKKRYYQYMQRNSGNKALGLDERKKKLQLVIDEATMTLNYFKTLNMDAINQHVKDYLYNCLMDYAVNTLHMGERIAIQQVPESIARMYDCIMNGMCLYNYERYCKKLLHNYKKKGNFGNTGRIPNPIQIEIENLNLDCLWERYKVTKQRR